MRGGGGQAGANLCRHLGQRTQSSGTIFDHASRNQGIRRNFDRLNVLFLLQRVFTHQRIHQTRIAEQGRLRIAFTNPAAFLDLEAKFLRSRFQAIGLFVNHIAETLGRFNKAFLRLLLLHVFDDVVLDHGEAQLGATNDAIETNDVKTELAFDQTANLTRLHRPNCIGEWFHHHVA